MLNSYEFVVLKQKLNSGDHIDPARAIYTLVRHIEQLEQRVEELEREHHGDSAQA